jgi:hypothetical protein
MLVSGRIRRAIELLVLGLVCAFSLSAGEDVRLSEQAYISLLTCSPSEEEVFTVYGHTAIRVYDPETSIDLVFNYGIFDFRRKNFVYRFAKGETDYKLGVSRFENFYAEYQMRNSGITEQRLNLSNEEKARIWEALLLNARPENAVYRYNFFFDNCATRPAVLVEQVIEGQLIYHHDAGQHTFRDLINECMRNKPWLLFGCELALGSPTDRLITPRELLFLPLWLELAFDRAVIVGTEGEERPLVLEKHILLEYNPEAPPRTFFTPLLAACLWLCLFLILSIVEWRRKTYYRAADCFLFAVSGLCGCVLFFLAFVSEHPATYPNWLILWLHPFHLLGAVLIAVKNWKKAAYSYHFITFAALTLMLLGWHFIPQHFHAAFFPLVLCMWMRSGWRLLLRYNKI